MIEIYNTPIKKVISINGEIDNSSLKKLMLENSIFSIYIEKDVQNLDFLKGNEELINRLYFMTSKKFDYNIVSNLSNLNLLSIISIGNSEVNFNKFYHLKQLNLHFDKKFININIPSQVELLSLRNWKTKSEKITLPIYLIRLEIIQNHLENLSFIEKNHFPELGLYYMPKLESLEGIFENKKLKKLTLQSCKRFKKYEEFLNFPDLEEIIIEDCGLIESIQILKKIPKLKSLQIVGNNDLKDKDIAFIKELNYYYVCGEGGGKKYHERHN